MDGIKTGYVRASGYNLAASVPRDGKSLIVIVFGGSSSSARNARVAALIEEYSPTRALSPRCSKRLETFGRRARNTAETLRR